MSERASFTRVRDSTSSNLILYGNRSNDSSFQSNRNNDSLSNVNALDASPTIMFYLLISLIIPSIICFIFVFYNFIRFPQLRIKPTNLLIICLLNTNLIHMLADLPFRLYFLHENQVPFSNPVYCLIWTWYDNILTTADLFIMAFTSIERYFFVFHHLFHHRHKRLLSHVPIILCFTIPTIWYTVLIFGYPCRNTFQYDTFQCGTFCYLTDSQVFSNFENFVFFMFPLSIIVVGNSSLIICVLIQKGNMKRKYRLGLWRNNLRMISQLMFIAVLYMSIYIPSSILLIFGSYIRRSRFQPWAASVRVRYFTHLKYLIIFGCPFVILAGQTEMHKMIKKIFCYQMWPWRAQQKTQVLPMGKVPAMMNGTTPTRP